MPSERLGKGTSSLLPPLTSLELLFHFIVFVTGNAGKLREVREILAQGPPIEVESRDLDRECELP
jgi:hypothetical protein